MMSLCLDGSYQSVVCRTIHLFVFPNTLHLIFISVYEKQVFHHANIKALFIIARRREFEIPFYALLLLLLGGYDERLQCCNRYHFFVTNV